MMLEFLPEAGLELYDAAEYYESRQQGLGSRFRNEVLNVCLSSSSTPCSGVNGPVDTGV